MKEKERILMECRYLLSINKSYKDIANRLNVSIDIVRDDLTNKLKNYDFLLYERVKKVLENINIS